MKGRRELSVFSGCPSQGPEARRRTFRIHLGLPSRATPTRLASRHSHVCRLHPDETAAQHPKSPAFTEASPSRSSLLFCAFLAGLFRNACRMSIASVARHAYDGLRPCTRNSCSVLRRMSAALPVSGHTRNISALQHRACKSTVPHISPPWQSSM